MSSSLPQSSVVIVDDTEVGIPTTSSILEYAKRTFRPQRNAPDELHHTVVQYSRLNERALAVVAGGAAASLRRGGNEDDEDEPWVVVSFVTNIALGGKTAFAVRHRMSEPVSKLRLRLIQDVGVKPTGPVSIHRSDTDEPLPLDKTLLDCGFRFPPTLRVHHYLHEVYMTVAKPLLTRIPLPWSPSMTLSALMALVHKRLQPRSMHDVRLSLVTHPNDGGQPCVRSLEASSKVCLLPRESHHLRPNCCVCDIVAHVGPRDPVSVHFLRSKDGFPLVYTFAVEGQSSVAQIAALLQAGGASPDSLETFGGGDVYAARAMELGDPNSNDGPFDDEDEEIYAMGMDGNVDTNTDTDRRSGGEATKHARSTAALSRLDDPLHTPSGAGSSRPLYHWTAEDWCAVFARSHEASEANSVTHMCAQLTRHITTGLIVSFAPPPSVMYNQQLPQFVSIESDYRVPHLTDLGVWPGSEIMCEVYDPQTQQWSGEVEGDVAAATQAYIPAHELITLRCVESNRVVRVPCTPTTPMEVVLTMLWMATGALPMFTVLLSERGRLIAPFETLASLNLLPQTTLFFATRPRAWLRESLPDVRSLPSASVVPEPPGR